MIVAGWYVLSMLNACLVPRPACLNLDRFRMIPYRRTV